jgi:hypothetical protein
MDWIDRHTYFKHHCIVVPRGARFPRLLFVLHSLKHRKPRKPAALWNSEWCHEEMLDVFASLSGLVCLENEASSVDFSL